MIQSEGDQTQTQTMPPEMATAPPPQQVSTVDIKVLLVGNMEPEISHMKEFLQRNIVPTYRVYHCIDALEATGFLKEMKVDVVLLDFGITEKEDAEDIFKMIRHNARNTPVIIFTGEAEIDLALLIMNEGATDSITREKYTARPKSLKDAIEDALIKKKMLAKAGSAAMTDVGAKSAGELAQVEEKYAAKLLNIQEKSTEELKKSAEDLKHSQEKSAAELRDLQEKSATELKDLYAKKLADIEYHRKVLSWMGGGYLPKNAETKQSAKKQGKV